MKITISDTPSRHPSGIINLTLPNKEYGKLIKLGAIFRIAIENRCPKMFLNIEAVKIEAENTDHDLRIEIVKFRIAFNAFSDFENLLPIKIINVSGLWDIDHSAFWYNNEIKETVSGRRFLYDDAKKFNLKTNIPEEAVDCMLEALAKTIEKISDALYGASKCLKEKADQIRETRK